LCVITVVTQESGDVLQWNKQIPFIVRLANALVSYVTYGGKMIYPTHLAVFYPHPGNTLPLWKPIISFVLLVAISAGLLYFGRRKPYLTVGWLWFLGTLVPVIGLVQAGGQAMADRYAYIPLIGLFIIVVWGATDLLQNWKYRRIILGALSIAVVLVLSVCTWAQTSHWRNSQTLFEHALKVTSGNYIACNNLGVTLLEQNKFDEAINLFNRALQIKPDHVEAYNNLGMAYGKLGWKQEEMEAYKQAIKIGSNHAETYCNLGSTLSQQGRCYEAIDAFKQAVKINPDLAQAYYGLGAAYGKIGRTQDEMDAYRKAIKINPLYYEAYTNLGVLYGQLGRFEEAINNYLQAVKIKPEYADAYNNLGVAFGQLGRYQESIQAFRQAVHIKPNFAEAHCGLGISYLQAGDKDSALNQYEILKKLDMTQANKLLNLISSK
jgi:tetratricopeptide (TPR) repeat protein